MSGCQVKLPPGTARPFPAAAGRACVAAAGTVEIRADAHRFGRMGSRPYGDAIESEEGIRVPPVRHALRSPEAVGRERNGSPRPPGRRVLSRAY
ncbi:hypothetical protein TBS_18750 [Thermobispora bispora]